MADNSVVCPKCGKAVAGTAQYNYSGECPKAPNSVAGFVCSLLSLFIPVLGLILAIVGLVLCGKGKAVVSRNPGAYSGTGLLTAGRILGVVGLVFSIIFIFYLLIAGLVFGGAVMSVFDLL